MTVAPVPLAGLVPSTWGVTNRTGVVHSSVARFDGVVVTYLAHDAVDFESDVEAVPRAPGTTRLMIVAEGSPRLRGAGAETILSPRDSALVRAPGSVGYASDGPCVVVMCDLPAGDHGLAGVPMSAQLVVGRADSAVPGAFGAFLVDLLAQDLRDVPPSVQHEIAEALRSLVQNTATALTCAESGDGGKQRQYAAALRYVGARYADPELSPNSVAEHLGISVRGLQRLFEGEKRSPAQYIHDVRTQRAIARLRDPRLGAVAMADIATLSGFGSTRALRRAVRDATGLSPMELRAQAARAAWDEETS